MEFEGVYPHLLMLYFSSCSKNLLDVKNSSNFAMIFGPSWLDVALLIAVYSPYYYTFLVGPSKIIIFEQYQTNSKFAVVLYPLCCALVWCPCFTCHARIFLGCLSPFCAFSRQQFRYYKNFFIFNRSLDLTSYIPIFSSLNHDVACIPGSNRSHALYWNAIQYFCLACGGSLPV